MTRHAATLQAVQPHLRDSLIAAGCTSNVLRRPRWIRVRSDRISDQCLKVPAGPCHASPGHVPPRPAVPGRGELLRLELDFFYEKSPVFGPMIADTVRSRQLEELDHVSAAHHA
jgi:hypothetical protein